MDEIPNNKEINSAPIDEPIAEEPPMEEPSAEDPVTGTYADNSEEAPTGDEPAEEEPFTEEPAPEPQDTPTEEGAAEAPAETTEPDIIAAAESETPAENAPVFPNEPNPKPKTNKPLIITLIALFVLALSGTGIWYFLLQDKGTEPTSSIQNDIEPIPDLEPIPANKLALRGNELSDFDLSFLYMENKAENIVYSPLSIKYALAMLADGADGQSKEQITSVIGGYQPKAYLNSENRSLANAMFIRTDFSDQVKADYKTALETKYNASLILDPFTSPDNANQWVEDKTLGIIKNTFTPGDVNTEIDYVLINALAIDMQWNYRIQCATSETWETDTVKNMDYDVRYAHEDYKDYVACVMGNYETAEFNNTDNVQVAKIGTSVNRYDIIKELGEEKIRETVQAEWEKWTEEQIDMYQEHVNDGTAQAEEMPIYSETYEDMDSYISSLSENYGKISNSTDFYYLDGDTEKAFAKDLQEYDGTTLQYVGIMPKSDSLNSYLNSFTAEKATAIISNLKDASDYDNYKEGVITRINGYVPFFKFDFTMSDFMTDLEELGITDVFNTQTADLSNMIEFDKTAANKPYISVAIHKADIDFSNDGIKAGAVTAFGGKGAGGGFFDYKWEVPVEEIDLTFNKPFLFLIRDKNTGEVWFVGTVYEGKVAE